MIRDITQLVSPHPEPPSKDCHFDRSLTCSLNHSLFQEEQGPCGALVSSQRVISSLLPPTIPRLRTLIGKTGYVLQLLSQDPEPPLKDSCFFTASSKLCQRNKYYLGKLSKTQQSLAKLSKAQQNLAKLSKTQQSQQNLAKLANVAVNVNVNVNDTNTNNNYMYMLVVT